MGRADAARAEPPAVRVDLLGPLRLTVGDRTVAVPGPKRRALLALLATADGRAVPVDDLLDALWPGGVPADARGTLQSHVSRLRAHLGAAAGRLEGGGGAYRLTADTDVQTARSLHAQAKKAAPAEALVLLREARGLWRGTPLAEFPDVPPLAASAVTLAELERALDEAEAVAALEAGAVPEAVGRATALVAADPLSEAAVLVLMRSLAAAGRAAAALRAGHEYRHRLAEETGLAPSDGLATLESEIAGATAAFERRVRPPPTRLRGRDSELAALHRLLGHERLVTIVGPGGVGKTRLGLEAAARAESATALLLAPVTDAASLGPALADALGLRVVHGDVLGSCTALLGSGPQLLLLDSCEHLLAGTRALVTHLMASCPGLTILATSREPLSLPSEQTLRVAPLSVARPRDLGDLDRCPAVALFVDRARRVRPGFVPGADELVLVQEVVRHLDGMPLAIELAAGRLSSLDLADLHARLDRALDLLGDGRSTLRQALAWSYDLLPDHERRGHLRRRHRVGRPPQQPRPDRARGRRPRRLPRPHRLLGANGGLGAAVDDAAKPRGAAEVPGRRRHCDVPRSRRRRRPRRARHDLRERWRRARSKRGRAGDTGARRSAQGHPCQGPRGGESRPRPPQGATAARRPA